MTDLTVITHADDCWSWGPKHYECAASQRTNYTTSMEATEEVLIAANEVLRVSSKPAEGEKIMVNTPYDVFILPLQPSGLSSGPRFVVHVPGPEAQAAMEQGGGKVVAWRVPVVQSPFGEWLDHGVRDGLVLVMHRGTHGWKAAGQGHALLAHQVYVKNVEPLCATSHEVAVVGLSGGGWRTVWARSDDDVTYPAPPSAPAGVEEMQRRLDREESDHGRTIDQRDAAEDALGRMFQAVTGRTAEWSSAWGYVDAIEEVEEHVATIAAERDQLAAEVEALRAEVEAWRELSDHVRVGACKAIWPDRYVDERIRDVAAALKRAERLAEALRVAREYVVSELAAERDKFAGYEHCSNIASIEADLAKIDAALAAHRKQVRVGA